MRLIDLRGKKFGRLLVVERGPNGGKQPRWHCVCECGNETLVQGGNLRSGDIKSCGCYNLEALARRIRHGESNGGGRQCVSPEYGIWAMMRQRCLNPRNENFAYYGGRGIRVCKRWGRFENFLADMGRRPSSRYSLDRIDNDGDYKPSNCRWITRAQQGRNQRSNRMVTINGQTKCVTDWFDELNVSRVVFYQRVRRGLSDVEALMTPRRV